MPRDGSGNYTLPVGNPVVSNTVIASSWANDTMSDIATQLNNVLTRDGILGPVNQFKLIDGNVSIPGLGFNSEPGLGLYRINTSILGFAAAGKQIEVLDASTAAIYKHDLYPRSAGTSEIRVNTDIYGTADSTVLRLGQNATNGYLTSTAVGAGTVKPIVYTALSHGFLGTTRIQPNTATSVLALDRILDNAALGTLQWETASVARFKLNYTAPAGEGSDAGFLQLVRYDNSGVAIATAPGSAIATFSRTDGSTNFAGVVTGGSGLGGGGTGFTTPRGLFVGEAATVGTTLNVTGVATVSRLITSTNSASFHITASSFAAGTPRSINVFDASAIGVTLTNSYQYNVGAGTAAAVWDISGAAFSMSSDGIGRSAGGWVATSDRRVKTEIAPISDALQKLRTLGGYTYCKQDQKGMNEIAPRKAGYIAQEIQAVLPEAVMTADDEIGTLSVDHNGVIGLLIEAVKELDARTQIH